MIFHRKYNITHLSWCHLYVLSYKCLDFFGNLNIPVRNVLVFMLVLDRGTTTLVLFVIESLRIITPNDDFCMNDDFLNNDYVYFKKCQVRP